DARNSTITGNRVDAALQSGGGIFVEAGGGTLNNVTVASNTAQAGGGGIQAGGGVVTLENSILSGSTPANCGTSGGSFASSGGNVENTTGVDCNVGGDTIGDPKL